MPFFYNHLHIYIYIYLCIVGSEAKRVFDEAQIVLERIISKGLLTAHGVVGLFPAHVINDDIIVFNEDRSEVKGTLYGLRQQV